MSKRQDVSKTLLCGIILLVAAVSSGYAKRSKVSHIPKKIHSTKEIFTMIAPILPKDPIIVEAGAFNGKDSVLLANFWQQGHVHSFEPVPELYAKVVKATENCNNVSTYQVALADKEGTADFYISSFTATPGSPSASSSLLTPTGHLSAWSCIKFKKKLSVPTITIDAWAEKNSIGHVDFIWLDTQGSELSILKSAPRILKTVKAMLLEVEFVELYKDQPLFTDVKTWLEANGFKFVAMRAWKLYGDALFVRTATR
ncbi:MAG: FkbM family methyltransferase [Candidatus Babeliales bacterium]|jgi:FkbM family methyltransferase